jgi:hypothetical protein
MLPKRRQFLLRSLSALMMRVLHVGAGLGVPRAATITKGVETLLLDQGQQALRMT